MLDPRSYLTRSLAQTAGIIDAVRLDQLDDPTPCTEYNVRALLSHMVGGVRRTALVGEGADAFAQPARADEIADDAWAKAYRQMADRAAAAWDDAAKLDAIFTLPWGSVPGRAAIAGYTQETLTHGWDLAKATGQPTEGDAELALFVLDFAAKALPESPRGGDVPFEAVVAAPDDAGPYTRLAAWLGRRP
jgi:uncharacterized protein (TIGR03086 family)